jgi:excisionase family DNA binding protein
MIGDLIMEFLTVKETAQLLRVSPITVRRYIASGRLAAERVGRGIRVRREAIEEFVTPIVPGTLVGEPTTEGDPLWGTDGICHSVEPRNVSEHEHTYLADARLGEIDDDEDESDPDQLLIRPFTMEDPLWRVFGLGESDDPDDFETGVDDLPTLREQMGNIVGIGRSSGPNDVSANKYKYLADAYESDRG